MGGGDSQTIEQTFNLSAINKSVFNQITMNQQSLSAAMNNIQQLDVEIQNMGPLCDVKLGQKINATSQSSVVMAPETIAETKDTVSNELQASANAALEKTTELGNLDFLSDSDQDVKTEINMAVENVIEKTFETNNINEIVSEMVNIQEGRLRIGNCNGKLDFQQDIVALLMAEAITESLTSAIAENEILNKLVASSDADVKSKGGGFAGIFDSIFGGVAGVLGVGAQTAQIASVASVICVCVIILALLTFMMSPAGQNATGTLANAGAKRI